MRNHSGCVNALTWNGEGTILASGSDDRRVVLWDAKNNFSPLLAVRTGHSGNVFCVTFIENSSSIVTSGADGSVRLIDTTCGTTTPLFESSGGFCFQHVMDPITPSSGIATMEDRRLIRFDARDTQSSVLLDMGGEWTRHHGTSLAFNPIDPFQLAVGTNSMHVSFFDMRNMSRVVRNWVPVNAAFASASGMQWDRRNNLIINFCSSDILEIDATSGLLTAQYTGRQNAETFLKDVALFGSEQQYVLSGGDCGNLFVWQRGDPDPIAVRPSDPEILNSVASHPTLPLIATSGLATTVDVWSVGGRFYT
jgi:DDB1- and CUL4-associated factor 8